MPTVEFLGGEKEEEEEGPGSYRWEEEKRKEGKDRWKGQKEIKEF